MSAILGDLRFYQENIFTDIYTVNDSLLSRIFADNILIKVAKCALVGRCGQPDNKRVKAVFLRKIFSTVSPESR